MGWHATARAAIVLAASAATAYAADYAPLNCSKAGTPTEHAICDSYALGQSEARMATLFAVATSLVAMGQRGDIQDAQRRWLAERDACGPKVSCLSEAYDKRIHALDKVISGIASRGPY